MELGEWVLHNIPKFMREHTSQFSWAYPSQRIGFSFTLLYSEGEALRYGICRVFVFSFNNNYYINARIQL